MTKLTNPQFEEVVRKYLGEYLKITRVRKQAVDFRKQGHANYEMAKALEYWYDVKENDPAKSQGGIGILSYIFAESNKYWEEKEQNKNLNLDLKIEDLEPPATTYHIRQQRIRQPKRTKFFNLE